MREPTSILSPDDDLPGAVRRPLPRRRLMQTAGAAWAGLAIPGFDIAAAVAQPSIVGRTCFRVLWKNKEIGNHTVDIEQAGPSLHHVVTSVALKAKAGPLTLYRFDHHCEEQWDQGRLVSLRSTTNDDGQQASVTGQTSGGGLTLLTPNGQRQVPGDILTSNSLWTSRFPHQRQILDARIGDLIAVAARPAGQAMVNIRGWTTAAEAYELSTTYLSGTVLYWQDRWVGGRINVRGEMVSYQLV